MEEDWLMQFWGLARKADLDAHLRSLRDWAFAEVHPHEHTPGCVTMDGEWICSPFCPVNHGT